MPDNFRKLQCLFLATCLAAGMAGNAQAGSVQFSTYYPAPFGMYDRLRLVPRAALIAPCDPGTFYYETGTGLKLCDETATWGILGGSGGFWSKTGSNLYPTTITDNVGIGTATPRGKLSINGTVLGNTVNIESNPTVPGEYHLRLANNSTDGGLLIGTAVSPTLLSVYDGRFGAIRAEMSTGASATDLKTTILHDFIVNGKVGIGISTPIASLHINNATTIFAEQGQTPHGNIHVNSNRPYITFADTDAANPTDAWRLGGWDVDFVIAEESDVLDMDLDHFFIQRGSGNVHIGDTTDVAPSPTAKLHILQAAAADALRIDDEPSDTSPFIVDATGNVGIGTTVPTTKLEIVQSNSVDGLKISQSAADGNAKIILRSQGGGSPIIEFDVGTGNKWLFSQDSLTVPSLFSIRGTFFGADNFPGLFLRAGTALSSGVGIGTSTPSAKLSVSGGGPATVAKILSLEADSLMDWDIYYLGIDGLPADAALTFTNEDNTETMRLTRSGRLGIGTTGPGYTLTVAGTAWVTSGAWTGSDRRWKKNITPLNDSLNKIMKLQGVNYDWKVEEFPDLKFSAGRQIGLIAQDTEQVIPEIVTTDNNGYKGISYEKLTSVLVEAIKELKAENEALKKRIEALEARP